MRVDLNISLDGFATTTDQTPGNPFGEDLRGLERGYDVTTQAAPSGTTHVTFRRA